MIGEVNYYFWKGAYACNIGNWLADESGTITLFLGQGAVNTVLQGNRTQIDGVVITPVLPDLLITAGPGAGQVTLTWNAPGWSLQTSPNVAIPGGWTDTAQTSPALINVTPGSQFFRLKSP